MLDSDGYILSWNAGAERFKGYTAEEVMGRHFSLFYTPEDRQLGIPALALKTAETSGKFETEGWRVRKDGSRFWAHVVVDPITDPDGNLVGFAKITRDLTQRQEAQEKLEQATEAMFQSQRLEAIGKFSAGSLTISTTRWLLSWVVWNSSKKGLATKISSFAGC